MVAIHVLRYVCSWTDWNGLIGFVWVSFTFDYFGGTRYCFCPGLVLARTCFVFFQVNEIIGILDSGTRCSLEYLAR